MISPGPWKLHCGSGVNVKVDVIVGRGVPDGMGVKVSVGRMVWVTVAGWVEEGSGLIVQVGANVGKG